MFLGRKILLSFGLPTSGDRFSFPSPVAKTANMFLGVLGVCVSDTLPERFILRGVLGQLWLFTVLVCAIMRSFNSLIMSSCSFSF